MRVLLTGGSGMIGQGVLLECLKRADVTKVVAVGRTPLEQKDPKLEDLIKKDLFDWRDVEPQLAGLDAVLFCLGVSSGSMSASCDPVCSAETDRKHASARRSAARCSGP